ncbi:uncharacterized protein LOC129985114 isoform X2 [Argiope bruennichi]|uniref:uncharacterized protein LOC129985114 isoform X2 n=1 Tax=Argiope bruennichi TaxID=94029 RepID=UPI0024941CA7|nr:uncharacterized protein LOC129985114 isoform X2 [Argiope bruennichi]
MYDKKVNVVFKCYKQFEPFEWTEADIQNQDRLSDSEETGAFELDNDSKIKPEVELKEETDNFIYKADFRGHLQLVSLSHEVPNQCLNHSDSNGQWQDVNSSVQASETGQITLSWQEVSEDSDASQMYRKSKNESSSSVEGRYYIKEEPSENNSQNCSYGQAIPEIYDYSSDTSWHPETDASSQLTNGHNINKNMVLLTQAEKKRLYRLRIKAENPAMWSSIKQKEAARKREQREKRRHIILEMQKAMELAGLPESPDVVNHKLYLEALKESYPEIWEQLINALPATQLRNEQVYNKRTSKSRRNSPKPAKMYKDVIEAQKKRLYRQRMKEERPEMYERQKARDAYARSIQRLMSKKKQLSVKNGCHSESIDADGMEKKLTYLQNVQMEDDNFTDSKFFSLHLMNQMNNQNNSGFENSSGTDVPIAEVQISETSNLPPGADGGNTQSDPSEICDNIPMDIENHSKNSSISIVSDIPNEEKSKESCEAINTSKFSENLTATICSTQSDILWYWNDVKNSQYSEKLTDTHIPDSWIKRPQVLTEEERLQKILKERMHLKEKRKRYRMNMSPERRTEFLETERERLKAYRQKKKAAEAAGVCDANSTACVDQ